MKNLISPDKMFVGLKNYIDIFNDNGICNLASEYVGFYNWMSDYSVFDRIYVSPVLQSEF